MDYEKNVLPDFVVPNHYELTLTPNFERDYKYRGSVAIHLELRKEGLRNITLHARELELGKCIYTPFNLQSSKGIAVVASIAVTNNEETTVDILFPDDLPDGEGVLSIGFVGKKLIRRS